MLAEVYRTIIASAEVVKLLEVLQIYKLLKYFLLAY